MLWNNRTKERISYWRGVIICAFHVMSRIMRWECRVACVGMMRNAYNIFVGKPEVEKLHGRPSRR
jgi:hypothetical protein